jgi:hypothetical protein
MRKLAWFVIILLVIIASVAVACAIVPSISAAVYDIGVNYIGVTFVNLVTGSMTGMMAWGATGLGPAAAIFFGVGIGFTILWLVVLRKYIWNPLRGVTKTMTPTLTLRGGPEPELPQLIEQSKPTEVPKEGS